MTEQSLSGPIQADSFYGQFAYQPEKKEYDPLPALKAGNQNAFDEIFETYFQRICYYAWQLVGQQEAAKDIALETFGKIWEKRARFQNLEHLRRFMYVVTRNAGISWLRNQHKQKRTIQGMAMVSDEADHGIDCEKIHTELIGKVYQLIDDLPGYGSRILRLSLLEGRSHEQIARELDISPNAVAVKKFRAITMLKTLLRKSTSLS